MSTAHATPAAPPAAVSPWAPLRQPTFRALWLAILVGNIGTWIHDVAAGWMMSGISSSPLMVAAVQSATTLPVVLFALVAGALADIVDRRKYLIICQLWMLAMASLLAGLSQLGLLGPWSLLILTFALGSGAAMAMPAQAAITSELVPRPMLAPAIALNSVSMNIARSIGPALGGLVVAQWGVQWAFALNALSFLGVAIVLWRWRRVSTPASLPAESFGVALRAGLRYVRQASVFQAVLVKAIAFFVFASALTALLPLQVRGPLAGGPGTFGLLLGAIGAGALVGAVLLPRLRAVLDRDRLVLLASLAYAGCMVALALVAQIAVLCAALAVAGFAWIGVLSSLQIAAQMAVPAWVRARALSLYIVVFALGMSLGGLLWGAMAQAQSIRLALLVAAGGAVLAGLLALRFKIASAESVDVAPSAHWPEPLAENPVEHDRGPVLVTVEYLVDAANREAFLALVRQLGRSRRRDGAVQWAVLEDVAAPGVWLEHFLVGSWLEHLRQHQRVTGAEQQLQAQIRDLLEAGTAPTVRHFVGGAPVAGLARPDHAHQDA